MTELISIHKTRQVHKVNLVLRDLTKAFDRVWHAGLLYKLDQTDFPLLLLRSIHSFLSNRTATIKINSFVGPPINIYCGVPQGSPLSPTIFNFYTHDLPSPIAMTDHVTYADDVTQLIHANREPLLNRLTIRAIDRLNDYERTWKIKTNTDKFVLIPIGHRPTLPVIINDRTIPYASNGKVLGLRLSTNGYKSHITNNIQSAQVRLARLYRFRQLSAPNRRKLYNAYVDSTLLYPTVPLHATTVTNMTRLQRVQNRGTRYITGHTQLDRLTSQELHRRANLTPINQRLHDRATKLWSQYYDTLDEDLQLTLENPRPDRTKLAFPSSLAVSQSPTPPPIYR